MVPKSGIPSKLLRQITVQFDRSVRFMEPLLPGGIYILCYPYGDFGTQESIQCLEVHTGRLAWAWSQPGIYISSATFDFRLGSSEAVVALTFAAADRVLLCEVNLATGQSRDLLDFTLPGILWFPKLLGDFFICHARPTPITPHWFILLLNFRTEEFVVLECATDQPVGCFALLPGHLALAYPISGPNPPMAALTFHLHSITNFDRLWRPLREFDFSDPIGPGVIPSVHFKLIDIDTSASPPAHSIGLSVAESLVHRDTYEITIQVKDVADPPPPSRLASLLSQLRIRSIESNCVQRTTISRYDISLSPRWYPGLPRLTQKSVFRHSRGFMFISGARYGLQYGEAQSLNIWRLDQGIGKPKEVYTGFSGLSWLTHSGAVVVLELGRAVILYYE